MSWAVLSRKEPGGEEEIVARSRASGAATGKRIVLENGCEWIPGVAEKRTKKVLGGG